MAVAGVVGDQAPRLGLAAVAVGLVALVRLGQLLLRLVAVSERLVPIGAQALPRTVALSHWQHLMAVDTELPIAPFPLMALAVIRFGVGVAAAAAAGQLLPRLW